MSDPTSAQVEQTPANNWTNSEKWAWYMIKNAKAADFSNPEKADDFEFTPDPKKEKELVLTSKFLESILLYEKYNKSISRKGVEISGARFNEEVDLEIF